MLSPAKFTVIDRKHEMCEAWKAEFENLPDALRDQFEVRNVTLAKLTESTFDCIVSPANSFGLLDGGFDYYISETLATSGIAFERPTRVCQAALYKKWHGYAPPGTCTLVELPQDLTSNKFQCRYIALCPTMRSPEDVSWARDISYDCMWSLLNELDIHSAEAEKKGQVVVRTVLMTGFGTGVGKVSAARCAKQMSLAIKQFGIAKTEPDKWGAVEWSDVEGIVAEIKQTRLL